MAAEKGAYRKRKWSKTGSLSLLIGLIGGPCNMVDFYRATHAKCGICRRRVSVRLSVCVCHISVLYQNG